MSILNMLGNGKKKTTLYEEIIKQIWAYIEKKELNIGDRVPSEMELAGILNVSRNTVREACRVLQMLGVLESNKRVGMTIRNFTLSDISSFLPYTVHAFSSTLKSVVDARLWFELSMIDSVVDNATGQDIERLETVSKELIGACIEEDVGLFLKADMAFHLEYYRCAHNDLMTGFGSILLSYAEIHAIDELKMQPATTENMVLTLSEHKKMIQLIRNKDKKRLHELVQTIYASYGYERATVQEKLREDGDEQKVPECLDAFGEKRE